jgi:hypothetical protein
MKQIKTFDSFINESETIKNHSVHGTLRDEMKPFGFMEDAQMMKQFPYLSMLTKGNDYDGIVIKSDSKKTPGKIEWEWSVTKGGKEILAKKFTQDNSSLMKAEQDGNKVYPMIKKDLSPHLKMIIRPIPNEG